jgi:hypothetical protein
VLLSIPLELGFIHQVRYSGEEGVNARLRHDEGMVEGIEWRRGAKRSEVK